MSYSAPPPPPPPPPAGGMPGYPAAPNEKADKKALWALISSIVGLICCGVVLGVVAIVLAGQAEREGATNGLAKPAKIIGVISIVLSILGGIYITTSR